MTKHYVTMTWDNFPEGGSFGAVIEAENHDLAEKLCRQEMADSRADEDTHDGFGLEGDECDADWFLDSYASEWHVIDCFDLDAFLAEHATPVMKAAPDLLAALMDLRKELSAHIKFDIKKHFSLMATDAAAGTAIAKATGT